MGKRGRQYANILERLDDLSGILARLDAIAPPPDAGTTTYHATSDPEIWLKRTIAEVPAREAMHWYARTPANAPATVDFSSHPFWESHYLEAHADGTMMTRERTPAQEPNQLEHLIDQCREGRERAEEAFQRSTDHPGRQGHAPSRTPADTDAYG